MLDLPRRGGERFRTWLPSDQRVGRFLPCRSRPPSETQTSEGKTEQRKRCRLGDDGLDIVDEQGRRVTSVLSLAHTEEHRVFAGSRQGMQAQVAEKRRVRRPGSCLGL